VTPSVFSNKFFQRIFVPLAPYVNLDAAVFRFVRQEQTKNDHITIGHALRG